MVFGQRLFQRIESNWWTTHGTRVEDFPRIHYSGNPLWDSIEDGKITVWTGELHMQHHLSWQYLTLLYGMQKEMMNYDKMIQGQLKSMRKDSLAIIGLSWIWKEVVRNLRLQTRWILESNCRENAAEFRRNRSSYIPWHQCIGERRLENQRKWKEVNALLGSTRTQDTELIDGNSRRSNSTFLCCHWSVLTSFHFFLLLNRALPRNIGWSVSAKLLLQMVITVNQLSIFGAVADMIEESPVGRRALGNLLHQVSWINKKFLHNLLSQKCKPMKSDSETCCKYTSNDLRNCQKTRNYPDYAPKQVWDLSKLDNSSILFHHQEEKQITLYAENIRCLEIKKELV